MPPPTKLRKETSALRLRSDRCVTRARREARPGFEGPVESKRTRVARGDAQPHASSCRRPGAARGTTLAAKPPERAERDRGLRAAHRQSRGIMSNWADAAPANLRMIPDRTRSTQRDRRLPSTAGAAAEPGGGRAAGARRGPAKRTASARARSAASGAHRGPVSRGARSVESYPLGARRGKMRVRAARATRRGMSCPGSFAPSPPPCRSPGSDASCASESRQGSSSSAGPSRVCVGSARRSRRTQAVSS